MLPKHARRSRLRTLSERTRSERVPTRCRDQDKGPHRAAPPHSIPRRMVALHALRCLDKRFPRFQAPHSTLPSSCCSIPCAQNILAGHRCSFLFQATGCSLRRSSGFSPWRTKADPPPVEPAESGGGSLNHIRMFLLFSLSNALALPPSLSSSLVPLLYLYSDGAKRL